LTEITNKQSDSKNSIDSKVDYIILNLDLKEYRKVDRFEKKEVLSKITLDNFNDQCLECKIDLDIYKQIYIVKNPEIYEKKNINPKDRYSECFYIYTQCRLCDSKHRIGDRIYNESIKSLEKQSKFHKIYKWFFG
jgi:hypothetical protein